MCTERKATGLFVLASFLFATMQAEPVTTKQIAQTSFKQKVIMLKKFCVLLYKQAIPDRMEFF